MELRKSVYELGLERIPSPAPAVAPAEVENPLTVQKIAGPGEGGFTWMRGGITPVEKQPDPPKAESKDGPGFLSDTGNLLLSGMDSLALGARWLTGKVPGGDSVVKALDDFGNFLGMKSAEGVHSDIEKQHAALSPEMKTALDKEWISEKDGKAALGDAWGDWRSYWGPLVQSLPGTIATMGPTAAIGLNVGKAAMGRYVSSDAAKELFATTASEAVKKGATLEAAKEAAAQAVGEAAKKAGQAAAGRAAYVTGGFLEGSQQAGDSGRKIESTIMAMPIEKLRSSEAFQGLEAKLGPLEARKKLASDQSVQAAFLSFMATAPFGGAGDAMLVKALGKSLEGGVLKRMAKGAVAEGLLEEAPQSGLSQVAENVAMQQADPSVGSWDGAANQAVGGAVVGGLMGGGMAAPFRARGAEAQTPPGAELPPEQAASAAQEEAAAAQPAAPTPGSDLALRRPSDLAPIAEDDSRLSRINEPQPVPEQIGMNPRPLALPGPAGAPRIEGTPGMDMPTGTLRVGTDGAVSPEFQSERQASEAEGQRLNDLGLTQDIRKLQFKTPSGKPYLLKSVAENEARRAGGTAVPVQGGYAVQLPESAREEQAPVQPPEQPQETQSSNASVDPANATGEASVAAAEIRPGVGAEKPSETPGNAPGTEEGRSMDEQAPPATPAVESEAEPPAALEALAAKEGQSRGAEMPAVAPIPRQAVLDAYRWTSHTPERRADAEPAEFRATLESAWKQATAAAKGDPVALDRIAEVFADVAEGYRSRYLAYLGAKGRTASPMITGPARFPTERNRKRLEAEHKRSVEAREYLERGIKRLLKAASGPVDNSPEAELERVRQNLTQREEEQERMKAANAALRKGDDQALRDLDFTDEEIARLKKPDYAGRTGFPSYKLTNNNAEIRRLRDRLASAEQRMEAAASGPVESTYRGVRMEENAQDDRLRLFFDGKPSDELRADLKANAFKWSPKAGAWQRQLTNNARNAAQRVLDTHFKDEQANKEEEVLDARAGKSDIEFASEVLSELAASDRLFRFPVSGRQTLEGVFNEVLPEFVYKGDATREDERSESGADKRHLFKSLAGKDVFVYERGNEVWLDVSRLMEGDRGAGVYAAVANYAHNAGKTFIGDPAGLSEAAVVRRTVAMLASALRFGTTEHLEAAPEQIAGNPEKGIAPLEWSGDDVAKTSALILSFIDTLSTQNPDVRHFRFDFGTRRFVDRAGNPVDGGRFVAGAQRGNARAARSGEATLRAGILVQSLVSSESGARPRLLEHVLRGGRALAAGELKGIFSRDSLPVEDEAEYDKAAWKNDLNAMASAFRQAFPGAGNIEIAVTDAEESPDLLKNTEGRMSILYDEEGHAVGGRVRLNASALRDGARAIEVLLHEIVGHFGLRELLGPQGFAELKREVLKSFHTKDFRLEQLARTVVGHYQKTGEMIRPPGYLGRADSEYISVEGVMIDYPDYTPDQWADEVLARMAERKPDLPLIGKIEVMIRKALRALAKAYEAVTGKTFDLPMSRAEVQALVAESSRRMRTQRKGKDPSGKLRMAPVDKRDSSATEADSRAEPRKATKAEWEKIEAEQKTARKDRAQEKATSARAESVKQGKSLSDIEQAIQQKKAIKASLKDRAQGVVDRIQAVFNPLSTLTDLNRYLSDRYQVMGKIGDIDARMKELRKVFSGIDKTTNKQTFEYLSTKGADPATIADAKIRAEAIKIKREINSVGEKLVSHGLIPKESLEKYGDAYLPRLYLKYLLDEDNQVKSTGAGKKPSDMGYTKERKDIPKEIRELILGEIKDAGFLSAHAIGKPLRDMAILDWLARISTNAKWVLPKATMDWNGQRVTPHWLASEADRIAQQAVHLEPEQAKQALGIAKAMRDQADAALGDLAGQDMKEYKQIPNAKRYGRLRGLFVRREIYDDLMGVHDFLPADGLPLVGNLFSYGGIGTKVTGYWKLGKVALNPPSQVRNAISNAVMLQLSGVALHRLPGRIIQAAKEMASDGKYWKIAKQFGVTEATFTTHELARINRDLLEAQREFGRLTPLGRVQLMAAPITDFAGDAYQKMETLFKVAKIIDAMESDGMNAEQAALEAHDWLFDYSLVSRGVRYARNAPIGMPFLTYTVKVLPKLMEVAIHHPQRFLPWVTMLAGLPMVFASQAGLDDDDTDKILRLMPEWARERGHMMFLPWKDADGRWQAADIGYFFPWTFYTDMLPVSAQAVRKLAQGEGGKAWEATKEAADRINIPKQLMGLMGGPIPDVLIALKTNRDSFTGREIVPPGADARGKGVAVLDYAWNMAAPPMFSSRGVISPVGVFDSSLGGKVVQAATGETNRWGEPRATGAQAGLAAVGVNTYGVDPTSGLAGNLMGMRAEIRQTQEMLVQKLRNQALTDEQRQALVERYQEEIRKRTEKMAKYVESVSGAPSPQ